MRLFPAVLALLLTAAVHGINEVENGFDNEDNALNDVDFGLPDLPTTEPPTLELPTTGRPDASTSSPEGPGQIGAYDPLPYPVIDSYPSSRTVREGDYVEFECKASDAADHLPNWPKHDLSIDVIYEADPKRDLKSTENDWLEDTFARSKSRPSHPKGRIDITEIAEIFLSKYAVKKSDEGWYRCVACIYKGDPDHEACDVNNARFYLKILDAYSPQEDPTQQEFTTSPDDAGMLIFESPRSACQVFGDPHIITFDKNVYNLPASSCDYVLALDQVAGSFFIYGRMRPCGVLAEGFCLESITIYGSGDAIELQRGWLVNYRGEKVETVESSEPINLGPFILEFSGTTLEAKMLLGKEKAYEEWLKIHWDGFTTVTIEAPKRVTTQGLCGNNNQDAYDDYDVWGGFNSDIQLLADNMRVDLYGQCESGRVPENDEEMKDLCGSKYARAEAKCGKLFSIHSFENCIHDKQPYIDACIYDQCKGMNIQNDLYDWMVIPKVDKVLPPGCNAAEAYAMLCSQASWTDDGFRISQIDMSEWENDLDFCASRDFKLENIPKFGCPQSFM